jgi:predicted glutamine amidotransferase
MCGLVGVIGNIGYKDKEVFQTLLILDVLRGPHSTGVAVVEGNKDITVVKKLGVPHNLFDSKAYDKAMAPYNIQALIGHNRHATKGAINEKNAHPFHIGDVVGCHNGTLTSTYNLVDNKDFAVDSENIIHAINEESMPEVLPELQGAYALSVYDSREDVLYLARNKERPLFYCWAKQKDKVYYASEEWMLNVALGRHGIEFGDIFPLPVGQLFQFKFDQKDVRLVIRKFNPYEAKPVGQLPQRSNVTTIGTKDNRFPTGSLVEFEVERIGGFPNGRRYIIGKTVEGAMEVRLYMPDGGAEWDRITSSVNTFTAPVQSHVGYSGCNYLLVNERSIVELVKDTELLELDEIVFTNHKGDVIEEKAWNHHTRHGCANCRRDVIEEEASSLVWFSQDLFACPDCIDLDVVKAISH